MKSSLVSYGRFVLVGIELIDISNFTSELQTVALCVPSIASKDILYWLTILESNANFTAHLAPLPQKLFDQSGLKKSI